MLVAASAVEHYLCKAFAAEVVDCRRYIPVETAKEAGLHIFYNYDIGLLIFGKEPMAYKNEDKDSLRTQIIRLGDLIFNDPTADKIMKDIEKTHGKITHPFLVTEKGGYEAARALYENPLAQDSGKEPKNFLTSHSPGRDSCRSHKRTLKRKRKAGEEMVNCIQTIVLLLSH